MHSLGPLMKSLIYKSQAQVPLLEKYLHHDAYPSPDTIVLLARQTNNAPRQIATWVRMPTLNIMNLVIHDFLYSSRTSELV